MNRVLQIAKGQSSEVVALMADGKQLRGRFFLARCAQDHYGQETLLDVLNRPGTPFVPFVREGEADVVLIQTCRIAGLRPRHADCVDWPQAQEGDQERWPPASIELAGRRLLGGACTADLPPDRCRLADLLNHENCFFVFRTDDGPWIINKTLLNLMVPLA